MICLAYQHLMIFTNKVKAVFLLATRGHQKLMSFLENFKYMDVMVCIYTETERKNGQNGLKSNTCIYFRSDTDENIISKLDRSTAIYGKLLIQIFQKKTYDKSDQGIFISVS